jgi:glycosyltransferase involved in cell wall biosynthesis
MLAKRIEAIEAGVPFAEMFTEIATCDEAVRRAEARDEALSHMRSGLRLGSRDEISGLIETAYLSFLGRPIEPEVLAKRMEAIEAGVPFADVFREIATSEEATSLRFRERLGAGLSDGQFLLTGGHLLYGRGLTPREVVIWQSAINEHPSARFQFALDMINAYIGNARAVKAEDYVHQENDPSVVQILGTTRLLTSRDWDARAKKITKFKNNNISKNNDISLSKKFEHTGIYKVSMIASLYKGGEFIRQFMENITSQTIFNMSELIIIDASSPDNEFEIIKEYQKFFPNIVYKRINYRIGIYEAWNVGVEMARGVYLTNTNLDDLRDKNSIALQSEFLDKNNDVDVVYQDFYYSYNSSLSFDETADFGFKSELPIVTPHNLLLFNSPHNAPMWRASLHEEGEKFDTTFRSAGDWEFWLRCLTNGKRFRKINTPHIAYYQNAEGISTGPNTRGVEEGKVIFSRYSPKLISPALLQSRHDFRASLGMEAGSEAIPMNTPYYDVAQAALMRLGASRPGMRPMLARRGRGSAMRVLIDGVSFQLQRSNQLENSAIVSIWKSLLQRLVVMEGATLFMLDRGGAPSIPGVQLVDFPSYTMTYTTADSLLIQEFCDKLDIDVFMSTYYTTATTTPQVQLVYDMIPEVLEFDMSARVWKEKALALSYASHFACISKSTRDDLLRFYKGIDASRTSITYLGVDNGIFNSQASKNIPKFCKVYGIKRPYFLFVGSREQQKNYKNAKLMFDAIKIDKSADFDIVCVGGEKSISPSWLLDMPPGISIKRLDLTDAELATAYSGALALIHPSIYEGSAMPVLEAMACGCPVISTRMGSLGEIVGDAAMVISGHDPLELLQALDRVRIPDVRQFMIDAGLVQAALFNWDQSADEIFQLMLRAKSQYSQLEVQDFHRRWRKLRVTQANVDVGLD